MQFEKVIGQKDTKEQLVHMVQHNRLSHALLFLGKEGSGALPLALAFAQYVVCEKVTGKNKSSFGHSLFGEPARDEGPVQTPHDSCGICSACIKSNQLIHPDIHFTYPVVSKKAGHTPVSTDYIVEWRKFIGGQSYGNAFDWLQFIGAENKQGNITAEECND
ncbi:MAG: hypothetical protein H7211_01815, partial [Aquabacterium sp.]|nr:hypothetical protein [Ferruginibacter sp.]